MVRTSLIVGWPSVLCLLLLACGPRPKTYVDAGTQPDAGIEADAGRPRGDDPPSGWQMAATLPSGAAASTKLGVAVAAIGDQFGQPLLAALYQDPNGDGTDDDNRVVFTRWDGIAKAYTALKIIEVVGGFAQPGHREISLARDPDTGRIGIIYIKPQSNTVRLAVSDDEGENFSLSTLSDEPRAALMSNPVLALRGGVAHAGWLEGSSVVYRKRIGEATFVDQSPSETSFGQALALGVDSAGNAGLAFFVPAGAASADLAFWRPGSAVKIVASADMFDVTVTGRAPSVSLVFSGTSPHLAYHLRKADTVDATELWYLKATDSGSNWAAPVAIPRNSSGPGEFHSTQLYQAIAVEDSGRVSVAAPWSSGGTPTNCTGPKLARSPDGLTFDTCSPPDSPVGRGGDWVNLWPHRPGHLTLVFHYDSRSNPTIKAGIVVWKEL